MNEGVYFYVLTTLLSLLNGLSYAAEDSTPAPVKCYKDEALKDRFDINIYYCRDPGKPECCVVNEEPTCCQTQTEHSVEQQAILFGGIGAVLTLVAIACLCYHKDSRMCDSGDSDGKCLRCCNRRADDKVGIIDGAETMDFDRKGTLVPPQFVGIVLQNDEDSGRGSALSGSSSCNDTLPGTVPPSRNPSPRPGTSFSTKCVSPHNPSPRPGTSYSRKSARRGSSEVPGASITVDH